MNHLIDILQLSPEEIMELVNTVSASRAPC